MNFYKHHIGDFDADTAHLSWVEDAAYRRLISLYYRREAPIPSDVAQACRLLRAASKDERAAVETVLKEFFTLDDEGWRSKRCDEEIEAAAKKTKSARDNGKGGGRPKKRTDEEPTEQPNENPEETESVISGFIRARGTNSQTPDARLKEKEEERAQSVRESPARAFDDPPRTTPAGRIGLALRAGGMQPGSFSTSDPRLIAIAEGGYDEAEVLQVAREASTKGKGFPWVAATLQGRRKDAAAIAIGAAVSPAPDWRSDRNEVIRRGCALGLGPYIDLDHKTGRTISFAAYRSSVVAADAATQESAA